MEDVKRRSVSSSELINRPVQSKDPLKDTDWTTASNGSQGSAGRLHRGVRCSSAHQLNLALSAELTERLQAQTRQQGVPLFHALLTGWVVLLGRWIEQEGLVLDIRVAWHGQGIETVIGAEECTAFLRVRFQEGMTCEQLLKHIGAALAEHGARQNAFIDEQMGAGESVRNQDPVVQTLNTVDDTHTAFLGSSEPRVMGRRFDEIGTQNAEERLELSTISLSERKDGVTATLECSSLFKAGTIEDMAACWKVLLEEMVKDFHKPISQLRMLTKAQRDRVVYGFNDTAVAYPRDRLIHELFEEQVGRMPGAVAVTCEGRSLTYSELNCRANQLARFLRDKGVRPEQIVGLCLERTWEIPVGLLGILKAGGVCMPLDPAYPSERLAYMIDDAAPRVLLTQERLRHVLPPTAAGVIALDSCWREIATQGDANLVPHQLGVTPRHLAYVIYTSGSTGRPKGVAAEHRGAVNRIAAQDTIGPFSGEDICCHKTSIAFVDGLFEILVPLSYGRPLVLASAATAKYASELASLIEREQVTRLVTVPSFAQSLLESVESQSLRSLRSWTLSGEELKAALLMELQKQLPKCTFMNLYGSSEVAADVTCYVGRDSVDVVLIGRPIANTQIYILDRHLQPVPIGVAGEIHIGGASVARGYLNRPELTAERFIPDPFGRDIQGRLFRSGDLGRWRADGTIEYLGRSDQQVKIRGFRIELGEIEAQLKRHAKVKEAVVVAREDVFREKRLVSYVTCRDQNVPTAEQLRAHLRTILPEYMVPSAFVILESLPLTPSGKLDRRALPIPESMAHASRENESPKGEVEETLAGIWQELLRIERVGRQDNFFELGGNSLLLMQMMVKLRRRGLSTQVGSVFEHPILADLATALTYAPIGQFEIPSHLIPFRCEAITPQMLPLIELQAHEIERIVKAVPGGAANVQDIYPLAPSQEGILFHHLLNELVGDTYVLPTVLAVSSRERLDKLIAALAGVINRHDVLRTAVLWEQLSQPVQVVCREATLPLEEIVLEEERDPAELIEEWIKPERQRMDLRRAPLMRVKVASNARRGEWYVLLQVHHLVDDDASARMVISEVMAHLEGREEELPRPVPYRKHVENALAYGRTHDAEAFFRRKLGDIGEPTVAFGLFDVHGTGRRIVEAYREFEPELAQRVRAEAQRAGVSVATLFHAAWGLVVARTSGRDDVVFGSVLLGRLQGGAEAQRTVGMFVNTLPLRVRSQGLTAQELVTHTRGGLVDLLNHEQASLAMAQRCTAIAGSAPLFNTVFNFRHSVVNAEAAWAGAVGIRVLASQNRTNYPIAVAVDDLGKGFALIAQTDRCIDPQRIVEYLHTAVQSLVIALERAPGTPAQALSILPGRERRQIIDAFNATEAVHREDELIHKLFEEQVERTPDAVALVYKEQVLTYAELNARANQLARYLRERGIGPDQLVAMCLDRGLEMVVGLLGILKAGGAYVPLDPAYPSERLSYMLRDAAPKVLLTQVRLSETLPRIAVEVIALDKDCNEINRRAASNLDSRALGLRSHHLAYVIYTSGSTGQPKGVMIEHGAVVNLWVGLLHVYGQSIPCHRIALNASLNFDASVQQLVQLLSGRTIFVVPQELRLDAPALLSFVDENQINGIDCTPTQLKSWISAGLLKSNRRQLHVVLVGGEAIDEHLWASLAQCSEIDFYNMYGPTECAVDTTVARLRSDTTAPHIGRPMANRRVYILDRYGQPVPIGADGEIFIGGAGVGRGYLNRLDLTMERFIADPFSADPRVRLYKTGDRARWRADGTIEYRGRDDHQVKIRGYRIELGEIEAQLVRHEKIKEALVVVREDAPGEKRLVSYVILRDPTGGLTVPSAEALRGYLSTLLPEYMVPSAFVTLDRLPMMPNGKVDRGALPAPEMAAYAREKYEPPQGEIEEAVARIWQELLRVERVGRRDNFFELGGHSLLATRVITNVSHVLDIDIPLRVLFEKPTIEVLGNYIMQQIAAEVSVEAS